MKHIKIAYATMSDYQYTCVSMLSVLNSAKKDTFIEFVILHGNDLTDDDKKAMHSVFDKYENHSLRFVDVSGYEFPGSKVWFIGKATYYRLVLADVVEDDKCIYLDSDTIVRSDLRELYSMSMEGMCLAGVKAVGYHRDEMDYEYCKRAVLPNKKQYINAGVLLMNLSLIREKKFTKEFIRRMSLNLPSQDQDVLNGTCYDYIKFLPLKYNTMVTYAHFSINDYYNCFGYDEILEAWNNPVIIHYADSRKPWRSLDVSFSNYWWDVCRRDRHIFEYFLKKNHDSFLYYAINAHAVNPRFFKASSLGEIILWGAGGYAKIVIDKLLNVNVKPLFCVVSNGYKEANLDSLSGIPIIEFSELADVSSVTLIIAVSEKIREEVFSLANTKSFRQIICNPESLQY